MTYLQLVNAVLARLRESSVATITGNDYASLIGKLVNDSKRQVEDSWNWDALSTTITITTAPGTTLYTATGIGRRHKDVTVNDSTNQARLINVPMKWIEDQQQLTNTTPAQPCYYAWNGSDGTDSKIEIYPTPDGVYTIKINCIVPQADLSADTDIITVPSHPVELGAYARAIVERGEDGGMNSSEVYSLYRAALADEIAIEASRQFENDCFEAV